MIFEFRCRRGHSTEGSFPMGQAPESVPCSDATCTKFDEPAVRLYKVADVQYKGSGFHKTDYK